MTLLREGTLIIRVYRAWWWAWLPATPVRAGNTDKRKYKDGRGKQSPLRTSKLWTMYTWYMNMYRDLYPGKSKTVPPPILPTRLMRFINKNLNSTKTNIRGKQYAMVYMHYLHVTWVFNELFFNYSTTDQSLQGETYLWNVCLFT